MSETTPQPADETDTSTAGTSDDATTDAAPEARRRDRTTAKAFHDAGGVEEWRVLFWGAYVHYPTDSFAKAAGFAAALIPAAEAEQHFPDVDVRPDGVTVRTFSRRDGALSEKDVALARAVSLIAREWGLESDPSRLQVVGIAVAQGEGVDTRPFWTAALGYDPLGDEDAVDPQRRNPHTWFHQLRSGAPGRGRVHIDVSVPADEAEVRVARALAAGGRIADSHAPDWWTLASPDNHGVDIAAWPDSEDEDW
jgi:4a-hydroxytetrahydrobiopterin dehydratase